MSAGAADMLPGSQESSGVETKRFFRRMYPVRFTPPILPLRAGNLISRTHVLPALIKTRAFRLPVAMSSHHHCEPDDHAVLDVGFRHDQPSVGVSVLATDDAIAKLAS